MSVDLLSGTYQQDREACIYMRYDELEKRYHIQSTKPPPKNTWNTWKWFSIDLHELGRIIPTPDWESSCFYEAMDFLMTALDGNQNGKPSLGDTPSL